MFGSSRDGNPELYSINADGSALRRLTWTTQTEQAPSVSSDGRIAFERDGANGRFRIWVMNGDGSGQTQVSSSTNELTDDNDPKWSPDGRSIAFVSTRAGTWNLWVMNADGSGLRRVSDVFAGSVAWSPDGKQLAYASLDGIGVVGLDGSNPHVITTPGSFADAPSWSPDGGRIVFWRSGADGYPGELYVVNADGSGEQQLTTGGFKNARPSWSPDGTQIVYQRDGSPSGWHLWTIGADGSGARQISFAGQDLAPDWGSWQTVPETSPPDAPQIQISSPTDGAFAGPGLLPLAAFYRCTSYVSFIVSCQGDVPVGALLDVSTAGSHTFTVSAVDADGRTASASVTYTVVDLTPPTIEIHAPANGAVYALGAAVTVDYSCTDPGGSGVAGCDGDRPDGAPLDTSSTGTHTFQVFSIDNSHNVRQTAVTYTVVAPPQASVVSPADGATYELGSTLLADYSCSAASPAQLTSCAGPVAAGGRLDTSTTGTRTFTVTALDSVGGKTTVARTYKVVGPPQIQIAAPTDGAVFTLGSTAAAAFSCSSPWGVPLVTCSAPVANQGQLDTGSIGDKTFTVSAVDRLGGTATATRSYSIVYSFNGFDSPVSAGGSLTGVKAGEPVPLKFSLQGDQGSSVITQVTWQPTGCSDGSQLGGVAPGQATVTYSVSTDRYLALAGTDPSWRGTCRTLDIQLADRTHHTVAIRFNK